MRAEQHVVKTATGPVSFTPIGSAVRESDAPRVAQQRGAAPSSDAFVCPKPTAEAEQNAIVSEKRATWAAGPHLSFERTRFLPGVTVEQASRVLQNLTHFSDDQFHKAVIVGERLDAGIDVQFDMKHTNWPMIPVHDLSKVRGVVTRWDAGGAGKPCYQTLLELQVCGAPTPDHEQAVCVKAVPGGVDVTWRVATKPIPVDYSPFVRQLIRRWVSFQMGRAIERKVNLFEGRIEKQKRDGAPIRTGFTRWFQQHLKPLLAYTPFAILSRAPAELGA